MSQSVSRAVNLAAAVVDGRRGELVREGQRALVFVEELLRSGVISMSGGIESSAFNAIMGAHLALDVPTREIQRMLLIRRAAEDDVTAREFVEKLRSGVYGTAHAAYTKWRKKRARSSGSSSKKSKGKNRTGRAFMSRDVMSDEELSWSIKTARKIKSEFKTPGRRALVMNRALIERGLASVKESGGPAASVTARAEISKALGVHPDEFRTAMTILRKEAANELLPGTIEAVETGRYQSCRSIPVAKKDKKRRFVEVVKDLDWIHGEARRVMENRALLTPSMRTIAFLESMVKHRVLSPAAQQSRQARQIHDVAVQVIGVARSESEACWSLLRTIGSGKLPSSVLQDVKDTGVSTARNVIQSAGGLAALVKSCRSQPRLTVEALNPRFDGPEPELRVVEAKNILDDAPIELCERSVEDLKSFVVGVASDLDAFVLALQAAGDNEGVALATKFRDDVGLHKMLVARLVNRRSIQNRGRS